MRILCACTVLELVINAPRNEGGFFVINGSDISQILITDVYSASPQACMFTGGNLNIAGGVNWGPGALEFTSTGRIVASDLDNYGTVSFSGTPRAFLLSAINRASGVLTFSDVTATVYACSNFGSITLQTGTGTLDSVSNEAGGTITATGLTATISNASNAAGATISVSGGTYTFAGNLLQNYGTIEVGTSSAGGSGRRLSSSATSVTIAGGVNAGTLSINEGTLDLTLDLNTGPIVLGAGVTGTIALGDTSTGTISGAGAAAVVQTTFVSSNPIVSSAGGGGGQQGTSPDPPSAPPPSSPSPRSPSPAQPAPLPPPTDGGTPTGYIIGIGIGVGLIIVIMLFVVKKAKGSKGKASTQAKV